MIRLHTVPPGTKQRSGRHAIVLDAPAALVRHSYRERRRHDPPYVARAMTVASWVGLAARIEVEP